MSRRALPLGQTLLLPRVRRQPKPLRDLADEGFILDLAWHWKDERRFLWIGPRWQHARRESYSTKDVYEGLHTSGLLVSPTTELDTLATRAVTRPIEALSQRVSELTAAVRNDHRPSIVTRFLGKLGGRLRRRR